MTATEELGKAVGVKAACEALTMPRATFYRNRSAAAATRKPAEDQGTPQRSNPRALSSDVAPRLAVS